jgi:hypothetical protein
MPSTYKPPKERRKKAPVKHIAVSVEARQAYENTIRERDQRGRDHTQFLPEEHKGKR